MRRAHDSSFLFDDNGRFYGVCLGADFCAEHEWGIAGLKGAFGIVKNDKKMGAEKTKNTTVPKNGFDFFDLKDGAILSKYPAFWDAGCNHAKEIIRCAEIRKNKELECAWDEKDFAIYVDNKHKDYLKQLHVAFYEKDIVFLFVNQFLKNGLLLVIYSAMPAKLKESLIAKDQSNRLLLKEAEKTGIVKYLNKHGYTKYGNIGWMALSPAWKSEERKSKSDIIFWLNPMQQDINNYGWFTVEELKQWPHGEGPIPKKNKIKKTIKPKVHMVDKTSKKKILTK